MCDANGKKMDNGPMRLLLVEDDEEEQKLFYEAANNRDDVIFTGVTDSEEEGLKILTANQPDGVILDLELHGGTGSGISFLEKINKTGKQPSPVIIVTTNVASKLVYNRLRDIGADFIYFKRQKGYSHGMVLNTMASLARYTAANNFCAAQIQINMPASADNKTEKLADMVNAELDLIGMGHQYKGRTYLTDCILMLINIGSGGSDSFIHSVADRHGLAYSSVIRSMQTAISSAWSSSSTETLERHYTVRVSVRTGVPSPTEFIYYYAAKIKKTLK